MAKVREVYGDEEAPKTTRAEDLRDRFQRNGKWVNEGGHEIHLTLEQALDRVQAYQKSFDTLNDEARKTKRALEDAEAKHRSAMVRLWQQRDTLDVHKMILAEKMEIPQ